MKCLINVLGLIFVLSIVPQYVDAEPADNKLSEILYKHQQKMQQLRTFKQEKKLKLVELIWKSSAWQAGSNYISGNDWLALVCEKDNCFLQPSTLKVSAKSWQGHYDEEATEGQQLEFSLQKPSSTNVIAQFKLNENYSWLKASSVDTYYSTSTSKDLQNKKYTFEIGINLSQRKTAYLVPLALDNNFKKDKVNRRLRDYDGSYYLQLRSEGRRQLLLSLLGTCSEMLSTEYLQWSGDLDRDGKADYLISFVNNGPVHLYLSSFAKEDEIVGIAGIHNVASHGGECR